MAHNTSPPSAHAHSQVAKELRATQLQIQVQNCLTVCRLEMQKTTPDLDKAFDFADRALTAIGTLRVMGLGVAP